MTGRWHEGREKTTRGQRKTKEKRGAARANERHTQARTQTDRGTRAATAAGYTGTDPTAHAHFEEEM